MPTRLRAFINAFNGILHGFKSEVHLKIHLACALGAVGLGVLLNLNAIEWCMVILCIGLVLAAELLNAAIERLADRITTDHDELIGWAKDLAAGAVLIASIAALVVGMIIFVPKLWLVFS